MAWVKQSPIDPHKLQEWALSQMRGHDFGYTIPYTNWPAYLLVTNEPSSFYIYGLDKEQRFVVVSWGGGFGHWGIMVGDTNLVMEKDGQVEKYGKRHVFQWIPGVYLDPYTEN